MNTFIKLYTAVTNVLESTPYLASSIAFQIGENPSSEINSTLWVTVKTTSLRWEAEFMQQVLAAHKVPARIVDLGIKSYMGQGSPAALQVQAEDEQLVILLLSVIDETTEASE